MRASRATSTELDRADRDPSLVHRGASRAPEGQARHASRSRRARCGRSNSSSTSRPDRQVSLTDPDARSMATSGRGTGIVGYNVQTAVDTKHHLIVAHEVTNVGHDRTQLAAMAEQAKDSHRPADHRAGRPRLLQGRGDPALRRQRASCRWCRSRRPPTTRPRVCSTRATSSTSAERRYVPLPGGRACHPPHDGGRERPDVAQVLVIGLSAMPAQAASARPASIGGSRAGSTRPCSNGCRRGSNQRPQAARERRQTVEHPFGTLKAWMGATHFLTRTLPKVRTEMSLHVLAYNMKRVIRLLGTASLIKAMQA